MLWCAIYLTLDHDYAQAFRLKQDRSASAKAARSPAHTWCPNNTDWGTTMTMTTTTKMKTTRTWLYKATGLSASRGLKIHSGAPIANPWDTSLRTFRVHANTDCILTHAMQTCVRGAPIIHRESVSTSLLHPARIISDLCVCFSRETTSHYADWDNIQWPYLAGFLPHINTNTQVSAKIYQLV